MVLRKPYAMFIKLFKPLHILMVALIGYLIYLTSNLTSFLSEYISNTNVELITITNKLIYILPLIVISIFILILGIMRRKEKPIKFYFIGSLIFLFIVIVNAYGVSFINNLEDAVPSVQTIKLIKDLLTINIILESIELVLCLIRGVGLDFDKFEFNSDLSKFEINEEDREEFEVQVNLDIDLKKRNKKYKTRNFVYFVKEKKILLIISFATILFIIGLIGVLEIIKNFSKTKEGDTLQTNIFSYTVLSSYILNKDYNGNEISSDYLVVVKTQISSDYLAKTLYLNDFSLKIGDLYFKPTTKYSNLLLDIGKTYDGNNLNNIPTNYLFTFQIPKKYITSDMEFIYTYEGNSLNVQLDPSIYDSSNEDIVKSKIGKTIKMSDNFDGISFKIKSYSISDKITINYDYCLQDDNCLASKEYLVPSIDQNFDKTILTLNLDYENKSNLEFEDFYELLTSFGSICYEINDESICQTENFEEIKSTKKKEKGILHIGVDNKIKNAKNIKIVLNVRSSKYEYELGEI